LGKEVKVIAEGCTVYNLSGGNGSTDRSHFMQFHFCNNLQFNMNHIDYPGPHLSSVGGQQKVTSLSRHQSHVGIEYIGDIITGLL
jgi:hypothetical protein